MIEVLNDSRSCRQPPINRKISKSLSAQLTAKFCGQFCNGLWPQRGSNKFNFDLSTTTQQAAYLHKAFLVS